MKLKNKKRRKKNKMSSKETFRGIDAEELFKRLEHRSKEPFRGVDTEELFKRLEHRASQPIYQKAESEPYALDSFMVFNVNDSGERERLDIIEETYISSGILSKWFSADVLVILKEELKRIYIWKGIKSDVQKRIIGDKIAQELQLEHRFRHCEIVSMDQGNEPPEFLKIFSFKEDPYAFDSFVVFEVDYSGQRKRLNITENQFRENNGINVLDSTKVLIIVKEDLRRIYIWNGITSPVRKKFIASRVAIELQQELIFSAKFHRCKIVSVDQGDEPQEFLNAFGLESMGITERLRDLRYIRNIERKIIDHTISKQDDISIDFQYIMKKLEDSQIPPEFEREFVIIGNHAYSEIGKDKRILPKISAFPDGISFLKIILLEYYLKK